MRRLLSLIGVCVLLIAVQIDAKENNRSNFWDLWGSDSENTAPAAASDDFTLEDGEGSGVEKLDSTHGDDEDFDVGSGDEEVPTTKPEVVDDKKKVDETDDDDDDYYDGNDDKKKVSSDDEDMFDGSGSGDDIMTEAPVQLTTTKPVKAMMTTVLPRTPCENLRDSAKSVAADFVPVCTKLGAFEKKQCTMNKEEKYCWCVNDHGAEINGTMMKSPVTPDCAGADMKSCVYQLVLHNQNLLGSYKPRCTLDGKFEAVQCQGSECWCVDEDGNEILGSLKNLPSIPDCSEKTTMAPKQTAKPVVPEKVMPESGTGYEVKNKDTKKNDDNDIVVKVNSGSEDDMVEKSEEETNEINEEMSNTDNVIAVQPAAVLGQPGLLAAIIGGAVVGLLCMVLLVMFIVYRMRKKDEGSYPLDEQKYQNYNYAKAPDKEFYA